MTLAVGIAIGIGGVAVLALAIYIVREAVTLRAIAMSLQQQLTQFKEGGFDKLVGEKLGALTHQAAREVEARERFIKERQEELVEQQRRATEAVERFKTDLGVVTAQITSLGELHAKVGELNDLLKPQQLRGELGEVIVRSLIEDKLPRAQYEEEHAFADGKKVEFVIRLNDRLVPIDSKLQLEDFKRMRDAPEGERARCRTDFKRKVKQKIDEVKAYIRPDEGTHNFALMVIPSEAVFYDIIAHKDFLEESGLFEYARSVNVFLVSPLTFWAYLTAIAQGLRGLEIERRAADILANLQTLSAGVRGFAGAEFRLLGEHLRNASNKYDEAKERLRAIEHGLMTLERAEGAEREASAQLTEHPVR